MIFLEVTNLIALAQCGKIQHNYLTFGTMVSISFFCLVTEGFLIHKLIKSYGSIP